MQLAIYVENGENLHLRFFNSRETAEAVAITATDDRLDGDICEVNLPLTENKITFNESGEYIPTPVGEPVAETV